MCFGGSQPSVPEVKYQGPSEADIRRNEQQLATFQQQMQQQQAQTAATIQQQIEEANARTAEIQADYDEQIAAATAEAEASYTPADAYAVTATQTAAPNAKTTEPIKAKKKPKTSLKISPTATGTAGSGLNIGV